VEEFAETCASGVSNFLRLAVLHEADEYTGRLLIREFVLPDNLTTGFGARRHMLEAKIVELLWPFQESHPVM
jgi:hypothetical protein